MGLGRIWRESTPHAKALIVLTNAVSVACLVWVLKDAHLESLGAELRDLKWGWVALAMMADVIVYVVQGIRWSILLEPVAAIPWWRSTRAIYVGLFANEVLPMRTGEVIRCYLQGRWSHQPFSVMLSSALIERIYDGVWLILFFFVTVQFVPPPGFVDELATVLVFLVGALATLVALVVWLKDRAIHLLARGRWAGKIRLLIEDIYLMSRSRSFYVGFLASLPYLLMQILPIYALLRAYGFDDSLWKMAAVTMVLLRVGTVVPSAPGNLGTFQVLTAMSLGLFAVEAAMAKRFSLILWGVITMPLLVVGFIALAITGLKISELKRDAEASALGDQGGSAKPSAPVSV